MLVVVSEVIWVILSVEESGLLGVTQQLSQFGGDFANAQPHQPMQNPFASPRKMDLEELPSQAVATMCSASFGCLQPGGVAVSPSAVQGSFNSSMAGDIHTTTVTASHVKAALYQVCVAFESLSSLFIVCVRIIGKIVDTVT